MAPNRMYYDTGRINGDPSDGSGGHRKKNCQKVVQRTARTLNRAAFRVVDSKVPRTGSKNAMGQALLPKKPPKSTEVPVGATRGGRARERETGGRHIIARREGSPSLPSPWKTGFWQSEGDVTSNREEGQTQHEKKAHPAHANSALNNAPAPALALQRGSPSNRALEGTTTSNRTAKNHAAKKGQNALPKMRRRPRRTPLNSHKQQTITANQHETEGRTRFSRSSGKRERMRKETGRRIRVLVRVQ